MISRKIFSQSCWLGVVRCKKFRQFSSSKSVWSCDGKVYPLDGIRVLDLTRIVAGPYCTMILSDLGADVIKIERPGTGDESRKWGPPFINNSKDSVYFMANNRNKRSCCIDLKRGTKIIYDLAEKCDILVENYVPGKLSEYSLGYEDVQKINPAIIYCSITGYGSVGPYAKRPGYDVIAASIGGLLHITGSENGGPSKVGVAVTDLATGLYAHGAIMAALLQRYKTGKGQKIEDPPVLRLNLRRTSADKKVSWNSNTVDNENMNRKKSKCCCIYKKPVPFGESSSEEDDDECDHCFGHVEKKKKNQKKHDDGSSSHDSNGSEFHACSS